MQPSSGNSPGSARTAARAYLLRRLDVMLIELRQAGFVGPWALQDLVDRNR